MQGVIGEYESRSQAEQAVRAMEQRNLSIQDVVIANTEQRTWRKLHTRSGDPRTPYLVLMIGDAPEIDRARKALQAV